MKRQIIISSTNELVRVLPQRIVYVSSDGNYSTMVLHDKTEHLFTFNLSHFQKIIETQLKEDACTFIRIGKSIIINKEYIYKINMGKQLLVLSDMALNDAFKLSASKEALRQLKLLLEKRNKQMKMKRNEEDEIQVLGTTTPKSRWKWIIIIISVLVVLLLLCLFLFRKTVNEQDSDIVKLKEDINRVVEDSTLHTEESAVRISKDSINDVPLTIYSLINLKAELMFDLPSKNDSTIFLAVQAADIRRDNKEILGDYVFKGKQLSTGKRKIGYCAIIDGNVSLGVSLNDEVKDYCIANNGYFFRQYALVIDGEVQENQLKGKAVRRALAKQGDDLYIIQSRNRESLYDFSEALADLGISDAIYLVGGDAYIVYRNNEDEQLYEDGDNNKLDYPTINYIAFKKKK